MEQQPLVSFIIPTYNLPEPLLRECIESIMSLSLREFEREIIVVDDGSKRAAIASLTDLADTIIYISGSATADSAPPATADCRMPRVVISSLSMATIRSSATSMNTAST